MTEINFAEFRKLYDELSEIVNSPKLCIEQKHAKIFQEGLGERICKVGLMSYSNKPSSNLSEMTEFYNAVGHKLLYLSYYQED